jgi:hypothetical protein
MNSVSSSAIGRYRVRYSTRALATCLCQFSCTRATSGPRGLSSRYITSQVGLSSYSYLVSLNSRSLTTSRPSRLRDSQLLLFPSPTTTTCSTWLLLLYHPSFSAGSARCLVATTTRTATWRMTCREIYEKTRYDASVRFGRCARLEEL